MIWWSSEREKEVNSNLCQWSSVVLFKNYYLWKIILICDKSFFEVKVLYFRVVYALTCICHHTSALLNFCKFQYVSLCFSVFVKVWMCFVCSILKKKMWWSSAQTCCLSECCTGIYVLSLCACNRMNVLFLCVSEACMCCLYVFVSGWMCCLCVFLEPCAVFVWL